MIIIKSDNEVQHMRKAGRVVAQAHEILAEAIRPGISTIKLDQLVEEFMLKVGAIPSFKGYRGFPASICASVNEVVVHGFPGERILVEGDIIGVDIGAIVDGFHGDAAYTYPVGEVSALAQRLLQVTKEALYKGITQAVVGNRLGDVSHAVQTHVEAAGFSVVRDYVGHGIGRTMHERPEIPNYGPAGKGPRLRSGMTLAIEPMVNTGGAEVQVMADQWTVVTCDASLSAHYEHTIAVTDNGPEILTTL